MACALFAGQNEKKETKLNGNRIEGSAHLSHELKTKPKCQNITLAMLPKVIRLLQWTKADQLGLIAVEQLQFCL